MVELKKYQRGKTKPVQRLEVNQLIAQPGAQKLCPGLFKLYFLLAECEVRTASYGSSFFFPFMAQARSPRAIKNNEGKNEDP